MPIQIKALLAGFCLVATTPLWAGVLPDACGSDKTRFEVSHPKGDAAQLVPDQAMVVFVESIDTHDQFCPSCGSIVARFGIDGKWVGASKGNSYFAAEVAPGEHHLCADWKQVLKKDKVGLTPLIAEAGKVYYYQVKVTLKRVDDPNPESTFEITPMNEDEGKFAIKASARSVATAKP